MSQNQTESGLSLEISSSRDFPFAFTLTKNITFFVWIRIFNFTHFIEASTIKGGSGQGVLKAQTMGKDDYIFLDERYNADGKKKRDEKEV